MGEVSIQDVLITKRDGGTLSAEQIRWFIDGYTNHRIADEQASALLMAILFVGMADDELSVWTQAMIDSGSRIDLSSLPRKTVDKHSTGGVGDKISLPLTPLVAACGAAVPQVAGRGLGHTGGTLDKMESITGWRAQLSAEHVVEQLGEVGAVICAAGDDLAPADRALYALRDVTATVESIPLIASSIMSKKIAEGTGALVLDVKCGSGAFMKDVDSARELARTMIGIGGRNGVRTSALITDMSTPLGMTAGNALEVAESIEVLQGGGPSDVVELTLKLASEMLDIAQIDGSDPADTLANGRAYDVWRRMVAAQGGDPDAPLPLAKETETVTADSDGFVSRLDAMRVGVAAWQLGAGRSRKEDVVDHAAGVRWLVRPGDAVRRGDVLFELHTNNPERISGAESELRAAVEISDSAPQAAPLIIESLR